MQFVVHKIYLESNTAVFDGVLSSQYICVYTHFNSLPTALFETSDTVDYMFIKMPATSEREEKVVEQHN